MNDPGRAAAAGLQPRPAASPDATAHHPDQDVPVNLRDFLRLFTALLLPMFLAAVDQTLLATATPVIAAELGGLRDSTWIAVGYLLAMTIMVPTYGRLGDRHGRRELLLVALGVFAIGCIACALAQSMPQLIVARVLQGLGGGGLMVMSHALIGELVPPRQRPRFQAWFASVFTLASVGGPVIGGLVVAQFSWRWLFVAQLPLVAFAAWRVWRLPAGVRYPASGGVSDFSGMLLFAIATSTGLVWVTFGGHRFDWLSIESLLMLALGTAITGWLIQRERRISQPFLPVEILRIPGIAALSLTIACFAACMFAIVFFLPVYLQLGYGASADHSGLLLLPLTLGLVVGATLTGRIVVRTRRPARIPPLGLAIAAAALVALAATPPDPWLISTLGLICGIGLGGVMPCAQVIIQSLSGRERLGAAAATLGLARVIGASLGTAGFGAIAFALLQGVDLDAIARGEPADRGQLIWSFHIGFITIAALALAGALHSRRLPDVKL